MKPLTGLEELGPKDIQSNDNQSPYGTRSNGKTPKEPLAPVSTLAFGTGWPSPNTPSLGAFSTQDQRAPVAQMMRPPTGSQRMSSQPSLSPAASTIAPPEPMAKPLGSAPARPSASSSPAPGGDTTRQSSSRSSISSAHNPPERNRSTQDGSTEILDEPTPPRRSASVLQPDAVDDFEQELAGYEEAEADNEAVS
jgi:hypothetical protein